MTYQTGEWTVHVDEKTGNVTVSRQFSRSEVEQLQGSAETEDTANETNAQESWIGKVWWCVTCGSGKRGSIKAYTEVDAGFGYCGAQTFSVKRGKC